MNQIKKIGLFGFGTVGKGFYHNLQRHPHLPVQLSKVCIKRLDLERISHDLYFTDDASEILDDPAIDIIIELTDDAKAAKNIVHTALRKGKSVISANKKMIAESLEEVHNWHQTYEATFLYEATVGGGIPIICTVDDSLRDYGITQIRGILNGSSNYILTQMQQKSWSFDQALEEAQKKGFAETDPTLDISGMDASYKLVILSYHAFGEVISLENFHLENLENVSKKDIEVARQASQKIKPVACIEKKEEKYICGIKPIKVDLTDELFNVDNEYNAISVQTKISDRHLFVGKGAGAFPTGAAVFSDLNRILKGYKYRVSIAQEDLTLKHAQKNRPKIELVSSRVK